MAPAGELQGLRDFFTDPKKTGHVCLLGRRTIALRSWTRWITVAVRVCVLVFLPYVLGVSGLTTVPPSSSGLRNENPLLASARAFGVSSTVLAAQSADTGIVRLSPQDTYLNLDPTNHAQQPTVRVYTWPDHRPDQHAATGARGAVARPPSKVCVLRRVRVNTSFAWNRPCGTG